MANDRAAVDGETDRQAPDRRRSAGLVLHGFLRLRHLLRNDQMVLILLAVAVGLVAALGAIGFRHGIGLVQWVALGFPSERVHSLAATLPWQRVLLAPVLGGLLVGLLTVWLMPQRRVQGVPHVIAAYARQGGRMPLRAGLAAALIGIVSLGCGGSAGREGPAVHLGASLASWLAGRLRLPSGATRTLLGCGVAAAVAASFNAPIAGVFWALEVVVGQYGLSRLAPVMLAAVSGTALARILQGDHPAFVLPHYAAGFLGELPVFALVGVAGGLVAIAFIRGVGLVERPVERLAAKVPLWLLPALGGLLVGLLALRYPQILGVGYEATDDALRGGFSPGFLAELLVAKLAATAVTLGFRFGGGVFSPALLLGGLVGGLAGAAAAALAPGLVSGATVYVLVGMGAMAAPVLGAPISTILIIFEMTGDYAVTLAVIVGVVMACGLVNALLGHSYFSLQLERRGIRREEISGSGAATDLTVADIMVTGGEPGDPGAPPLRPSDTLAEALRRFEETGAVRLAVRGEDGTLLGTVEERALLRRYVRALTKGE